MVKVGKKYQKEIDKVITIVTKVMNKAKDSEAELLAVHLCSNMLCGFKAKNQRDLVTEMVINTVRQYGLAEEGLNEAGNPE